MSWSAVAASPGSTPERKGGGRSSARLTFSAFAALLAPLLLAGGARAEPVPRPNFVLIMADDLGYGDIGPYGGWIKTPHLERLAAGGMRLTDFHSNGAVCSPTRAALLTGRYQQRAGIPAVIVADPSQPVHKHGLQPSETTFAESLAAAGYRAALFGKWHLGYEPRFNPVHHGFAEFRGYVSGNVDFFSHIDQAGRLDWWRNERIEDEEGYTTHLITRHAVRFIEKNRDRPFCLYLPHEAPHYPYQGPNDAPLRALGRPRGAGENNVPIKRAYREMVEELDRGVGEVLAALERHGLREQTFVFFCSDNGANQHGSNGPLRGSKGSAWEGGHRVPGIANWPGRIPAGAVRHDLCATFDLMPTLLSLADAPPPADRPLDGIDLAPLLFGEKGLPERTMFWSVGGGEAVRRGPWKFVRAGRQSALYNLADDLGETDDLTAEHPDRAEQLAGALSAWRREVSTDATPQGE